MKLSILTPEQADSLHSLLNRINDNIVIICHVSPDGDAIGSSLALARVLTNIGKKKVNVVTPDMPPRSLQFLSGIHDIVVASREQSRAHSLILNASAIFCLDFNVLMRVDRLSDVLAKSPGVKVLIDHHLYPGDFAAITVSHPECSSTCYLLYRVLTDLGLDENVDETAAESLTTGMMTDTGNFTYNSRDPELYRVIARMIEKGVDKDRIYKLVFDTNSETRLRICGFALYSRMHVLAEHRLALITLTKEELDEFGYTKGDTESLVNTPLSMPGIIWSVFMRQDDDNFVKISCRSKGHFPVNILCERYFGGGGHENAAGGEFYGNLDDAVASLLRSLPEMDAYLL